MPLSSLPIRPTILVAEDDADILEIISLVLTDQGYSIIGARNGREVQNQLAKLRPDSIILDNWMPGMSGKEVAKALKENPATQTIPIILISAHAHIQDMALESGVDGYLAKPFNIDDLIGMTRQFCPLPEKEGIPQALPKI